MSDRVPLDVGDVVLLDAIGAEVIRLEPTGDVALIVDLEGRLNKLDVRDVHRYVCSAGMAAELLARITVAAQTAATAGSDIEGGRTFAAELEHRIGEEQRRRGLEP